MEIAYVGPVPPLPGGISQHGVRLTEALAALGHTVHIYSWKDQFPGLLYKGPAPAQGTVTYPGASFELNWWSPPSWHRAGRRAGRSDLMVFPWVSPVTAPAYRVMLKANNQAPAVAIVHNLLPHERRPGDVALTRWVLKRVRGALLHASTGAKTLNDWGVKTAIVPHPPNLEIDPSPLPPSPPYKLLFFGHVRHYKGLDIAVESVRLLLDRGVPVTLTVAGHFWESFRRWEQHIAGTGLQDIVALRPHYVPDAEVARLFGSHHLILLPYRTATQSGIVPLARAASRPVVATAVGGLAEGMVEGSDGELAARPEPEEFAGAIARAIASLENRGATPRSSGTWTDVANAVVSLAR